MKEKIQDLEVQGGKYGNKIKGNEGKGRFDSVAIIK